MARSKSSGRWLQEHHSDPWVQKAKAEGWRGRAFFKLAEIDERDRLLKPGQVVVDLGAAPGGWSQYAARKLGDKGRIIAMDILPMDTIADVQIITGDFREDSVLAELQAALGDDQADLVLSDMAPNTSGMKAIDQPRSMYLCELALDFAVQSLKPGGGFLIKVFQGEGFEPFLRDLRDNFDKVITRKPKASRPRSREVYLLARGFRPS